VRPIHPVRWTTGRPSLNRRGRPHLRPSGAAVPGAHQRCLRLARRR